MDTPIHISFNTHDVRLSDRMAYWRDTICHSLIGVKCEGLSSTHFDGRVSVLGGGQAALAKIEAGPHRAWTSKEIPRGKDFFYLFVQNKGQMHLRRDEGDFVLGPGDLYLHDAETDHQFLFPEHFEHIALRVPKDVARKRWPEFSNARFMLLAGKGRPVNRLISSLSQGLMSEPGDLLEQEVNAAVTAAFDLFVHSVNARDPKLFTKFPQPGRVLERAKKVISANLEKSDLTPSWVAQEVGVSRRYLDKLFVRGGASIADHIQNLRLSRAASELCLDHPRGKRMSDFAFKWGFTNASHFSRAFRRKFLMSPTDYRALHMGHIGTETGPSENKST